MRTIIAATILSMATISTSGTTAGPNISTAGHEDQPRRRQKIRKVLLSDTVCG
jgi:hypothetical protein